MNQVDLFEGIAIIDVDGVSHDTYMTINTEAVGYTIRWFGTFGWIGDGPSPDHRCVGETLDVVLSDGRECKIRVPHPAVPSGSKMEFLGLGVPPGFESLAPVIQPFDIAETELVVQHSSWRVWYSRLFATLALSLVVLSVWWDAHRWEAFGTGFLFSLVAIHLAPSKLKEVRSE